MTVRSEKDSFIYLSLSANEFRVLILQPGEQDDPLVAILEHSDLDKYNNDPDYEAHSYSLVPPQYIRSRPAAMQNVASSTVKDSHVQPYEAISYVWGPSDFCRDLWTSGGSRIGITESLFQALIHLRHRDGPRRLWADAVCINQKDTAERSSQVAMMGRIYSSCHNVLIWLGQRLDISSSLGSNDETLIFATINHLHQVFKRATDTKRWDTDIFAEANQAFRDHPYCKCCDKRCEDLDLLQSNEPATLALTRAALLLRFNWFRRLWVVQEVALGPTAEVYLGWHHAPWAALQEGLSQLLTYKKIDATHLQHNTSYGMNDFDVATEINAMQTLGVYARTYVRNVFSPDNFVVSLVRYSTRKCQDPRDRVFALRALQGLGYSTLLKPDYNQSILCTFRDTVLVCLLRQGRNCDQQPRVSLLLALNGTQDDSSPVRDKSWPSWVPDFAQLGERSRRKLNSYEWPLSYQFRNDTKQFDFTWSEKQPDILNVRGKLIGTVRKISLSSVPNRSKWTELSNSERTAHIHDLIQWMTSCYSFVISLNSSIHQDLIDSTIRGILCCNDHNHFNEDIISFEEFLRFNDESIPVAEQKMPASHSQSLEFDTKYIWWMLQSFLTEIPHPRIDHDRYLSYIELDKQAITASGSVTKTTTGHFGWVPSTTRVGDTVLYIAGAPFLFVQNEFEPGKTRLLGDTWIQGVDEDRILSDAETGPLTWIPLH